MNSYQTAQQLDRDPTRMPCPTCNAAEGEPCTIRRGPRGRVWHLARQDRAIRKWRREFRAAVKGSATA